MLLILDHKDIIENPIYEISSKKEKCTKVAILWTEGNWKWANVEKESEAGGGQIDVSTVGAHVETAATK